MGKGGKSSKNTFFMGGQNLERGPGSQTPLESSFTLMNVKRRTRVKFSGKKKAIEEEEGEKTLVFRGELYRRYSVRERKRVFMSLIPNLLLFSFLLLHCDLNSISFFSLSHSLILSLFPGD